MQFDLTDLRLFVRAADEGALTRAALRQHLSLAAASARIKALEERFAALDEALAQEEQDDQQETQTTALDGERIESRERDQNESLG